MPAPGRVIPGTGTLRPIRPVIRRRFRKTVSCHPCRRSKLGCDRQTPCGACLRRSCEADCQYPGPDGRVPPSPSSRSSEASLGDPANSSNAASMALAEVERGSREYHWDTILRRPINHISHPLFDAQDPLCQPGNFFPFHFGSNLSRTELLAALPTPESCEYLVTQYFVRISHFFHVLHGPTFQRQFLDFSKDRFSCDLSWLALLFLICSASVNTMEEGDSILTNISETLPGARDAAAISYRYRVMAMICLCQDNFLIRHRLSTLEALLILIWTIGHNEGAERSWVLLGMALNTGIVLKCNASEPSTELNCIDIERRRRCWAGILMLHTYQAILNKDVDMSFLLNIQAPMPADVNDDDILEDKILPPSTQPTQVSDMKFKIRLFQLSGRICNVLSNDSQFNEECLERLDAEIAKEQKQWDSALLIDGSPSLLDTSSYPHWCVLQLYAHQLYLLLHRPFALQANQARYRSFSRMKCITSSAALLDIHRQLIELPRMRNYRWFAHGVSGFFAVHAVITLASCLLEQDDNEADSSTYRSAFDAAIVRLSVVQNRSPPYMKAYPVLRHLQYAPPPSSRTIK
ncbi:hypothetical protein BKA56DRAFT_496884 [Ilyonectria sp. MPI-CAGE-AT-0026]|nr:hypothetical protein BKA56DRAFT_496884 [Ilyonectria sp. MPI-CAGE-AT-0026]